MISILSRLLRIAILFRRMDVEISIPFSFTVSSIFVISITSWTHHLILLKFPVSHLQSIDSNCHAYLETNLKGNLKKKEGGGEGSRKELRENSGKGKPWMCSQRLQRSRNDPPLIPDLMNTKGERPQVKEGGGGR